MLRSGLFTGVFAIMGVMGCAGDDGTDGAVGPAGATGPQGELGDPGEPGTEGPAGTQGEIGPQGPAGGQGATGDAGPQGLPGTPGLEAVLPEGGLTTSCLSPCHGFTGIVEQWKSSTHFATYIANLGGEEAETWTGARACGNCHAIDGIEHRVADNVLYNGTTGPLHTTEGQINYLNSVDSKVTESSYAGHATVAVVSCSTCHDVTASTDPHLTGENYVPGSFPLRVPSGATDQARLEKSSAVGVSDGTPAGEYGVGNACIWCHKSRKDVTNYITASNATRSLNWGPHSGPHSDVYTGKGGYHYSGKTYGNSSHQALADGCIDCHMPDVASNQGVGNHSFYAQLSACSSAGCHSGATSFDIIGGQTTIRSYIQELRVALNTAGYLTREGNASNAPLDPATQLVDGEYAEDKPNPTLTGLTANQAGAIYNYLLLVRGSAFGVHNPRYCKQLAYDSIEGLGATPSFPRAP